MSKAVLDGAAREAAQKVAPVAPTSVPARQCPECLNTFQRIQPTQLFCCREHKRAYNNRWMARGAVLAPLVIVARITRNGSEGRHKDIGKRASRDADHLIQRFREEDQKAGRMPVGEYLAARYRLNLVEVA